jgi:propanediol dehydratase small subunit
MRKFPEDRTATELERDRFCNILIREVCMHEMRLAKATAEDAGRDQLPEDYHRAVHSTNGPDGIRRAIYARYSVDCEIG